MTKKHDRRPARSDESDLLAHWAAEEFVAAGRVDEHGLREIHRRRAAFFAETFRALSSTRPPNRPSVWAGHEIGCLLAIAFGAEGFAELEGQAAATAGDCAASSRNRQ